MVVLTKIDLVPPEATTAWIDYVRKQYADLVSDVVPFTVGAEPRLLKEKKLGRRRRLLRERTARLRSNASKKSPTRSPAADAVIDACRRAVDDDERGQVAKAFIVTNRSGDRDFEIELQEFTKERLARHEYPRRIEFANSLPKTPAGKVNRKILRDREAERNEAST